MRRVSIIQGQYRVLAEPGVMLTTVLGSCVAVCLHDHVARIGGMNHFLLGEPSASQNVRPDEMQRYGVHAMELLINGMMRAGAVRERLCGHLYGGANIIAGLGSIGSSNAAFARQFMETEGLQVRRCDLGGNRARKVEFLPFDGKVRSVTVNDPPPVLERPQPIPTNDVELF
ncbi:chemotaxis protein CheD [Pseudoblastomonas halimionae]|uniref:Probable chemoreceptor glutamine deamidase CheD n=1 Tax=Alteriqipengyuania halimionae TaxID=1926630 RepID=A0A6I4U3E9_9SPHN|nr:chemotaxis protein CheD [Alteriqipengyuania halimionae]MXP10458.1 chemotaxis protein CheD [Alteriqipengyuania halimionae]